MPENTIKKSYTLEEILNLLDQDFPIASITINLYYFSYLVNYVRKILLEKVFSIEKTTILINIGKLFESFEERQAISLQEDNYKEIDDAIDTHMQVLFLDIIINCAVMYQELITDIKFEAVILLNTRLIPDELICQIQEDMEEIFLS
jgi:hypothetical protein